MGDALQLAFERCIDGRVIMPVDVGPNGGVTIQIALPVGIKKINAFTALDHQWLVPLSTPVRHLGKRMPEMGFVRFSGIHRGRRLLYEIGGTKKAPPSQAGLL